MNLRRLLEAFMGQHQPATVTEQVLVETMAQSRWLILPISPNSSIQPDRPVFTADELYVELCREGLKYFKKVG